MWINFIWYEFVFKLRIDVFLCYEIINYLKVIFQFLNSSIKANFFWFPY